MSYTIARPKATKLIRSINADSTIIISCRPDLIPAKEISTACAKGISGIEEVVAINEPGIYFGKLDDAAALYEHLYENVGWFVLVMWVFNDLPKAELIAQGNMYDLYARTFNNKFITVLAESQ